MTAPATIAEPVLDLLVWGTPRAQGSMSVMRGHALHSPTTLDWRAHVTANVGNAWKLPALRGPFWLDLDFVFLRPKGHYGTGANAMVLKPTAPIVKVNAPDLDKLARAILDALMFAAVYVDDAQVAVLHAVKRYAVEGEMPHVRIQIGLGS